MSSLKDWPTLARKAKDLPELKKANLSALKAQATDGPEWMNHFSSLTKLLRTLSYIRRFRSNCKRYPTVSIGSIDLNEIKEANKVCIKLVQDYFKIDSNHLKSIQPFLDAERLLRVGGHLLHSNLDYDAKHPAIVSGKCNFVKPLARIASVHLGDDDMVRMVTIKTLRIYNCLDYIAYDIR